MACMATKVANLQATLRLRASNGDLSTLLVALSGGVDSAVLLQLAAWALPGRVTAATTSSAAVPPEEIAIASDVARACGVPHVVQETHELEDPDYQANDGRRCYFCRREMYGALTGLGYSAIADGLNADDLVADRAGVRAAQEFLVLHPLRDAGLGKAEIRRIARGLGLAVHDKPAQPCLASRLPMGVTVTPERLKLVLGAERALHALGYRELRVRCEDRHARIEIGRAQLADAMGNENELVSAVLAAGFDSAALDPAGYRSPLA
jgi:uncharacterized protein